MAGYTLVQAQAQLDAWMAASLAAASNQRYRISVNGSERELTRADANEIREQIAFWRSEVARLTAAAAGGRRTRYAVLW